MIDVIDDLRNFLKTDLRIEQAEAVAPDQRLLRTGVLDSIELMRLLEFVENRYGVRFDETEIVPDNVGSLQTIAAFVARRRSCV